MRVIAGTAKRLPLKTVAGDRTRPTTDRIKETLFNMLQDQIYDSRFLDLFAGSGGIGIEALSRGARAAVFVEKDRQATGCILENLQFTKLSDRGELIQMDVMTALKRLLSVEPFDIVFVDPPYQEGLERVILEFLSETSVITDDSLVIVEAAKETGFDYLEDLGFEIWKRKEYKTNAHMFLRRAGGGEV